MKIEDIRVLIVDDLPSLRMMLKAQLRRLGYRDIYEAEDGKAAYQIMVSCKAAGTPFHIIISDWNMPKFDGLELLRAVRAVPYWKALPFLLLTTESEKAKVVEAIVAGVSNYMVKPVDEKTLAEKLAAIWRKEQNKKAV